MYSAAIFLWSSYICIDWAQLGCGGMGRRSGERKAALAVSTLSILTVGLTILASAASISSLFTKAFMAGLTWWGGILTTNTNTSTTSPPTPPPPPPTRGPHHQDHQHLTNSTSTSTNTSSTTNSTHCSQIWEWAIRTGVRAGVRARELSH